MEKRQEVQTDFNLFLSRPIAHRGVFDDNIGENTVEAILSAVEKGFCIEIDVRMTADGEIVAIHDSFLLRLCGREEIVEQLTYKELSDIKLKTGQRIPTLEQILTAVGGRVPLLIEFKQYQKNYKQLIDNTLNALKGYDISKVAFQSFYPSCVKYAVKKYPFIMTGQLASGQIEGQNAFVNRLYYTLKIMRLTKAKFISFDINYLPNRYVQKYRKKGYKVLTWLVDDQQKYEKAKENSDNVIFEKIF